MSVHGGLGPAGSAGANAGPGGPGDAPLRFRQSDFRAGPVCYPYEFWEDLLGAHNYGPL